MSLLRYWPSGPDVNQCIKPEAEGVHEAVLLAVHQPSPLAYRPTNSDVQTATTEDELFAYFVTKNVPTGAHVVPITGASGVGKSHLIRILDARLRSSADADRYLIIRIPKSASLRKVVELILEHLPDKDYATVKQEFRKALAEVQQDSSAMRFQTELEIGLKELARSLQEKLRANPTNQALRERLDHARRLPILLSDAVTVEHFRTRILPRIAHRPISGKKSEVDDPAQGLFTSADLDLPDDIDLGKAAKPVELYYKTALQAKEGYGRSVAADVLNDVVDSATRQLFHLHEALGGMTLQEVILEIRRLLLKDKRELVLLVEDFAALTGIQETLANVLIQEGVRDGVSQYATMRSAIAVTDGYLAHKDTIATRATREWIVESVLENEDEVLARAKSLVASYLNAARWGQSALVKNLETSDSFESGKPQPHIVFSADQSDEVTKTLDAFGYEQKVPLFPFTELAIECLARNALTRREEIVFNPRLVINEVIRKILLPGRDAFIAHQFPAPGTEGRPPSAEIAQWLASLQCSEEHRQRYGRVVTIWGNNPQSIKEIGRIPGEVFEAFGLTRPDIKPVPVEKKPTAAPPQKPAEGANVVVDSSLEKRVSAYREALESWVQKGTTLEQGIASELRKHIAAALDGRIDWNGERAIKVSISPSQLSIPNARGEAGISSFSIKIAEDNRDPDGRLRNELLALLRFYSVHKKQADYEEADVDLARIANLLDRLVPIALELVRGTVTKRAQAAMLALAANSRLLGLFDKGRTPSALLSFLFGPPEPIEKLPANAPIVFVEWRTMQEAARGMRPTLQEFLLDTCGCFQGAGRKAQGLDISRIVEMFPASSDQFNIDSLDTLSPEHRELFARLSDARVKAKMKSVVVELSTIRDKLNSQLGSDFDKNEQTDATKELAETLSNLGAWSENDIGVSIGAFRKSSEEFRSSALKEALAQFDRAVETASVSADSNSVSHLAQLQISPILVAQDFVTAAGKLVTAAQRQAQSWEIQFRGVNPEEQAKVISQTFDDMLKGVTTIQSADG
jgi:hypothetical protein